MSVVNKQTNKIKILGITISSNQKFDKHLTAGSTNMTKSIRYKSTLLRAAKPFLPLRTLAMIGNNLINSTIMYGAPIWGSSSLKNIEIVQAAQTKVVRMLMGSTWGRDNTTHRQKIFSEIGWPNVQQIILMASSNLVRKAGLNQSSQGLNTMIKKKQKKSQRHGHIMRLEHCGPANRKSDTFSSKATQQFNVLPTALKDPLISTAAFKKKLKEHAMSTYLLKEH